MKKETLKEEATLEINPKDLENNIEEAKKETSSMPKPSDEEVKAAEEEFKKAVADWENVTFDLAPSPEIGQNFIDYIKDYMLTKMLWTQNAWMGAIKLEEELIASETVYHNLKKEIAPIIGYQALEMIVYILNNPGGTGLASAKQFEKDAEQHLIVLEFVEGQLEKARKGLDNIKWLQEKWAAYAQGFYIEKEPTDEEMPEGSYYDKESDRFLKPGDKGYEINKFIEAVKEQYGEKAAEEVKAEMEKEKSEIAESDIKE